MGEQTGVFNLLMVGVGGQGTVLASDIFSEAAMRAGLDVKKSEIHGMSQRGGPVFSHVRFGPVVHSPIIGEGEADVLYSLERMELLRWATYARAGGAACYINENIIPTGTEAYPEDTDAEIHRLFGTVIAIDPQALKGKVSAVVRSTVLLGAVSHLTPLPVEVFADVLTDLVPPGTAPLNQKAFDLGRAMAAEQLAARTRLAGASSAPQGAEAPQGSGPQQAVGGGSRA